MPLLTDKTGNVNDVNNYRAITLIPVISKVLEGVILMLCEDILSLNPCNLASNVVLVAQKPYSHLNPLSVILLIMAALCMWYLWISAKLLIK